MRWVLIKLSNHIWVITIVKQVMKLSSFWLVKLSKAVFRKAAPYVKFIVIQLKRGVRLIVILKIRGLFMKNKLEAYPEATLRNGTTLLMTLFWSLWKKRVLNKRVKNKVRKSRRHLICWVDLKLKENKSKVNKKMTLLFLKIATLLMTPICQIFP